MIRRSSKTKRPCHVWPPERFEPLRPSDGGCPASATFLATPTFRYRLTERSPSPRQDLRASLEVGLPETDRPREQIASTCRPELGAPPGPAASQLQSSLRAPHGLRHQRNPRNPARADLGGGGSWREAQHGPLRSLDQHRPNPGRCPGADYGTVWVRAECPVCDGRRAVRDHRTGTSHVGRVRWKSSTPCNSVKPQVSLLQ